MYCMIKVLYILVHHAYKRKCIFVCAISSNFHDLYIEICYCIQYHFNLASYIFRYTSNDMHSSQGVIDRVHQVLKRHKLRKSHKNVFNTKKSTRL